VNGIAEVSMLQNLDCPGHQSDTLVQSRTTGWQTAYCRKFSRDASMRGSPPGGRAGVPITALPCSLRLLSTMANPAQLRRCGRLRRPRESPPLDATGVVRSGFAGYRGAGERGYPLRRKPPAFGLDDPADAKLVVISVLPPGAQRSRSPSSKVTTDA